MALVNKLEQSRRNYILNRMGENYGHAHRALSEAPWSLKKDQFSQKIKDACLGLGYSEKEIPTFLEVAKDILFIQMIKAPPKIGGKVITGLCEKLVRKLETSPEKIEEEVNQFRFLADRSYHDEVMQRFYTELIPKLKE